METTPASTLRRALRFVRWAGALLLLMILLLLGLFLLWFHNRPQPEAITAQQLFPGISYTREVHREPRPLVVHVVQIDLNTPGLGFLVTPGGGVEGFDYQARTTSEFLTEFGLQLAVNGDFFDPWFDYVVDYYPRSGDGVNVRGLAASRGQRITSGYSAPEHYATLYIAQDNRVSFDAPRGRLYNAISGHMLLVEGRFVENWGSDSYIVQLHPRTAVALSQDERTLLLVVVDGRQPSYSEGVSMPELVEIILRHGGYNALNLDGGGSSILVVAREDGQVWRPTSPIHGNLPHNERPVANHLGVYVAP